LITWSGAATPSSLVNLSIKEFLEQRDSPFSWRFPAYRSSAQGACRPFRVAGRPDNLAERQGLVRE
jgi:hypothetical protein